MATGRTIDAKKKERAKQGKSGHRFAKLSARKNIALPAVMCTARMQLCRANRHLASKKHKHLQARLNFV